MACRDYFLRDSDVVLEAPFDLFCGPVWHACCQGRDVELLLLAFLVVVQREALPPSLEMGVKHRHI